MIHKEKKNFHDKLETHSEQDIQGSQTLRPRTVARDAFSETN